MTILLIIIGYIFITRAFSVFLCIFFWKFSREEWEHSYHEPSVFFYIMLPLIGDLIFLVSIISIIFYPLIWWSEILLSVAEEQREKKIKKEKFILKQRELRALKEELQDELVDREIAEMKSRLSSLTVDQC